MQSRRRGFEYIKKLFRPPRACIVRLSRKNGVSTECGRNESAPNYLLPVHPGACKVAFSRTLSCYYKNVNLLHRFNIILDSAEMSIKHKLSKYFIKWFVEIWHFSMKIRMQYF
jgi:hypothetical protein